MDKLTEVDPISPHYVYTICALVNYFRFFNTPIARPFSTTTNSVTSQADLLSALLGLIPRNLRVSINHWQTKEILERLLLQVYRLIFYHRYKSILNGHVLYSD